MAANAVRCLFRIDTMRVIVGFSRRRSRSHHGVPAQGRSGGEHVRGAIGPRSRAAMPAVMRE